MRPVRTIVLALIAVALMASTASASTRSSASSDWFGGYTISPDWNAGDYPAGQGCRDIDTWHTGRAVGVVDYEFHLYVHFCWAESSSGIWRFTTVRIRTGLTREGATAEYDGVYQKTNNYYVCSVGPGQKWENNAGLRIIRKAQITHHLPGTPGLSIAIGHAVVSVDIRADGSLGFWPYHNDSPY